MVSGDSDGSSVVLVAEAVDAWNPVELGSWLEVITVDMVEPLAIVADLLCCIPQEV